MNSYKFNSQAQFWLRLAIADSLNIPLREVYNTVELFVSRNVGVNGTECIVKTKDKEFYKLKLEKIGNDRNNGSQ